MKAILKWSAMQGRSSVEIRSDKMSEPSSPPRIADPETAKLRRISRLTEPGQNSPQDLSTNCDERKSNFKEPLKFVTILLLTYSTIIKR